MTHDRWERISQLYHAALIREPAARTSFLDSACAGDVELQAEVQSLLERDLPSVPALEVIAIDIGTASPRDALGAQLGPYHIQSLIGEGGMGRVYRAKDSALGREVAIKLLPPIFALDPDRRSRFDREARVLAALNHPHIGAIYGIAEGDGLRGLVLELVEGDTLADRLRATASGATASSGLPVRDAVAIARQIADGLDAAHEKGIVHRDLKPANIKITPEGTVKVLDFGLAKAAGDHEDSGLDAPLAETAVRGTRAGLILGTAAYMSPEQAQGRRVDKRTDIWAFGCVLYEMLTGRQAFAGETVSSTLAAILEREPDWTAIPPATPRRFVRLLHRCLKKDPKLRLRDIGDAGSELEDAPNDVPATMPLPLTHHTVGHFAWPIAVLIAVALAASAWTIYARRPEAVPAFSRIVRLTSGPSLKFGPAIAPDGKWVAYFSTARGPVDVWVKFLASGEAANLTAASGLDLPTLSDLGGLAISPDGANIAFDAGATKGTPANLLDVWVIAAPLGGGARRVVERGRALRWSRDGRKIAYIRAGAAAGDALYVADADGENERQVVARRGGVHVHWPAWSADGQYLYFNYGPSPGNEEPVEIYRVRANGGGQVEAVVTTARRAAYPALTGDGRGLIYAANPRTAELGLWWKSLDRPDAGPVRLSTGVGEYAEVSVAATNGSLVSTLVNFRQRLSALRVTNGPEPSVRALTDDDNGDLDPSLSPQGDRLVFSSARGGSRSLWLANVDGTNQRPLTSGVALDEHPVFSPDGRRIAFVSDRGGRRSIWVMSADGGAAQLVANAQALVAPTWSPNGQQLVYATPVGDAPGLWITTVADGATSRLPTRGPATAPVWSPRSDTIAYIEAKPPSQGLPSSSHIAFVDPLGHALHADLPESPNVLNGFLAWAPDGRHLAAVVEPRATPGAVWIFDTTGREPPRRVHEFAAEVRLRGASWTADGSTLVVAQSERTTDIVLFER